MLHARLIILAGLWLAGCAPTVVSPPDQTDDLLSGQVLFGEQIETSGIDETEVLAINEEMRTYVRKVEEAIASGDKEAASAALKAAQPEIMRSVTKGVLKKNTAARKVSRLSAGVKKIGA